MKCPNCGYFNLPNSQVCGRCSRSFAETPDAQEAWLPPRASQRSTRQKVESTLSPVTRRVIAKAEREVRDTPQNVKAMGQNIDWAVREQIQQIPRYRPWLQSVASLLPGLGQLLQRRHSRAQQIALIGIPATMLAFVLYSITSWALLLAAPFWGYSVFDAADYAFPQANTTEGRRLRHMRLMLFSIICATSALCFLFYFVVQDRFEVEFVPAPGALGAVFGVYVVMLLPTLSIFVLGFIMWWVSRSSKRIR